MKDLKLIALTGGIGSGKSLALSIIAEAGYKTMSCDDITADLYENRKTKLMLKRLFPTAVKGFIRPKIDRREISRIVFADKEKLELLTATVTPLVMEEVKRRANKISGTVFVEVPLLFERGYQNQFDGVIVVTRKLSARIESVKKRSKLTEEQILARIANQVNYDELDLSHYTVIANDGSENDLKEKVLSAAHALSQL